MRATARYLLLGILMGCRSPSEKPPISPERQGNERAEFIESTDPKRKLIGRVNAEMLENSEPCADVPDSERNGCVNALLRRNCLEGIRKQEDRLSCVGNWVRKHPNDALAAASLLIETQDDPSSFELARLLLSESEGSELKIILQTDLLLLALSLSKLDVAERVLQDLEQGKMSKSSLSLLSLRADLFRKQERWTDAAGVYIELLDVNPLFEGHVADVIDALDRAGRRDDVEALCHELSVDTNRTLQTLSCVRIAVENGMISPRVAYSMSLQLLGRFPGLTPGELGHLAPKQLPMLKTVRKCEQGARPSPAKLLGDKAFENRRRNIGLESAVYSSLASVEERPDVRFCFRGHAARTCAVSLSRTGECSDPRSIAVYLRSMAHEETGPAIQVAVESIEGRRRSSFMKLGRAFDIHGSRSSAAVALYEIHMMLAYEIQAHPELFGSRHSVGWHARTAIDNWRRIEPAKPFPIAVLDEKILEAEVNGKNLRDYIAESKMPVVSASG